MKILGKNWIEGIWFVKTIEHSGETAAEIQAGLAEFGFDLPDLKLSCQVTSITLPSRAPVDTTVDCVFLAEDLSYLHSFKRYIKNVQENGIAYGAFLSDSGKMPNRYRGGVMLLNSDGGRNRMQIGRKLTDHEVRVAQDKYGTNGWRQRALQDLTCPRKTHPRKAGVLS